MYCEYDALENVFKFTYLDTVYAADGLQDYDIRARMAKAMARCGKLGHMFDSPELGPWLKIRLYVAAVISLLTYGCETWNLSQVVMWKLNGYNSLMLVRITDRSVWEEARSATASFDVVKTIRVCRLRWLGEILRDNHDRLLFQAMKAQYSMDSPGNMFMDAPHHSNFEELVSLANDKVFWKSLESNIPSHLRERTIYSET